MIITFVNCLICCGLTSFTACLANMSNISSSGSAAVGMQLPSEIVLQSDHKASHNAHECAFVQLCSASGRDLGSLPAVVGHDLQVIAKGVKHVHKCSTHGVHDRWRSAKACSLITQCE